MLTTGFRPSEVQELQWEHVDLKAGELNLPDMKTGAKVLHLGKPAIIVLRGIETRYDNLRVAEPPAGGPARGAEPLITGAACPTNPIPFNPKSQRTQMAEPRRPRTYTPARAKIRRQTRPAENESV